MTKIRAAVYVLMAAASAAAPARAAVFTLSVSTIGPMSASVVVSSPAGISCGSSFTSCSFAFNAGSTVTLTETTGSTVAFAGWGGADGCPTTYPTCPVLMSAARFVEATFDPLVYVSLAGNGAGAVTSSGTLAINCSYLNACASGAPVTGRFKVGTSVVLVSTTSAGSTFSGWSGIGGCASASTCTFTVNGSASAVATFVSTGPFSVAVTKGGTGFGVVVSSPTGVSCGSTCAAVFSSGTVITFTATPSTGSYFAGWANGGCASTSTCVVVSTSAQQGMGRSATPTAFFYQ